MIIIGAKGFAKEVLEVVKEMGLLYALAFFDDVNADSREYMFGKFPILRNLGQAQEYFKKDNNFTLGIGNPILRKTLYDKFTGIGGNFISTISENANIGSYDVEIGTGTNILAGAVLSNQTVIGMGCLIYYNSIITHDCRIGNFVEISPGAVILGRCQIGSYSQIGANSTILPDIKIGENVIIGAGAVVTKDVPENTMVYGVPAQVIRKLEPITQE